MDLPEVKGTPSISAFARSPAGHTFCRASVALLRRLRSLEPDSDTARAEREALVLALVMQCCAWLEGYANDVCERSGDDDARNSTKWIPKVKDRQLVTFVHRTWSLDLNPRGQNAVDRWEGLFEQLGLKLKVSDGADVRLLVKLRNAFIHASPGRASLQADGWVAEGEWSKLQPKLEERFHVAPNMLFPRAILNLECAEWAFETAYAFAKHLLAELGMPDPFVDHTRTLT